MRWYDLFAYTYDLQLEALYRPWRTELVEAAALGPGMRVVDLGCGTGQDFDLLVQAVGPEGSVVGLDASSGMLGRARRRIARAGWGNVEVRQVDLTGPWPEDLADVDAVVAAMVLSALPADGWEAAMRRAWGALRPGGRFALLDAHAETRTLQTRMVEWIAQADLDRAVWEPLEGLAPDFRLTATGASPSAFGGRLVVATGTRPVPGGGS